MRELAPEVLGTLVRRYGHFDLAEDAVQEALLSASCKWPSDGLPDSPRGWLITVASRRLVDLLRSDQSRREREVESWTLPARQAEPAGPDDTLILLFMCCHPAIPPSSQIALTLRAVAGLSTAEIARGLLVSEQAMTRRITRAKQTIRDSHLPFRVPAPGERVKRQQLVLHALYLLFNEGYVATSGATLQRNDVSEEAIRLTQQLHRLLPGDAEVTGLLALMLLTHARRAARAAPDGTPVQMADQDRNRWDKDAIAEGTALVKQALAHGVAGPYQLQAAIAAVHDRAPDFASTDWAQIVSLYERLLEFGDNPVVRLNHLVAVAMVRGPTEGLRLLGPLERDSHLAGDHRVPSVRAHLQELAGLPDDAAASFLAAARIASAAPQRRYLHDRAQRLLANRSAQGVGPVEAAS